MNLQPPGRTLVHLRSAFQPRLRIVAFPFAGGGMLATRPWLRAAPMRCEFVAVVLPGREHRICEPPIEDIDEAALQCARAIAALPRLPLALLGHSLGALLAFLVARELVSTASFSAAHLFVSAFHAPQSADTRASTRAMSDEDFLAMLASLGGSADLFTVPELLRVLLPALRADFSLVEGFRYRDAPPLACPITAFAGESDAEAPAASMREWRVQTSRTFRLEVHPGDHFFFQGAGGAHDRVRTVLDTLVGKPAMMNGSAT